jgi:hypothetical protein
MNEKISQKNKIDYNEFKIDFKIDLFMNVQ